MEPVEIDFIIGGNVEGEGGKIVRSLDEITQAGKRAVADAKRAVVEQKNVIKQIESDIRQLEKKLKSTPPSNAKWELMRDLREAKIVLEEEKGRLDGYKQKVIEVANSHRSLSTKVNETKEAMSRLEQQGARGSAEWNMLQEHLADLSNQMRDTTTQARILADDQRGFRAVAQAAGGMAGAISAAVGAASLFGAENEDLIKIQTRLQSVMAITIGLQQVSEALNKDSYFSVVLLTKAKTLLTAANYRLATALGISTAAAQVLMGVLTLGLSVVITGVVVAFDKYISKQRESSKAAKEFRESVASSTKSAIADYEKLRRTYQGFGDDMKKKKEFIEANKGAIDKLGVSINNINDADAIFIKKTELFKASIMERAKSTAAMELAAEKYKAAMLKQMEADRREFEPTKIERIEDFVNNGFSNKPQTIVSGDWEYKGNKSANEAAEKIREEGKKLESAANKFVSDAMASDKKIADIYKRLGITASGGKDTKTPSTESNAPEYDHEKAIMEKLAELREQTMRLGIEQMEDGLQKRLAQIDHEGAAELAKVAETQQKIVEEYNKANANKKGFVPAQNMADIDPKAAQAFEEEVQKIKADNDLKREKAVETHQQNIMSIVRRYADERVQIEHDYNEDIKTLEAAGQTEAADRARAQREQAISEKTAEMIMESEIYRLAMDDRLLVSEEVTEKLIEDIRRRVEAEMAAGNMTAAQGAKILADLNKSGGSRGMGKNPFKDLLKGLRDYKKAKDELNKSKDSASAKELAKMEDAANMALKSSAAAAATALSGVQDIIGATTDALDGMGLMDDQQKKDAEDIMGMIGGAADIAAGIASGNPMKVIQGAVGFISKAASFFDFKSKRIKREQDEIIAQVNELGSAYKRLQREVDRAVGMDVFDKQREQIEILKKQILEFQRLIELENKKRKKKRNQEALSEWQQAIEDAKLQMEAIVDNIRDQLTGTDTKTLTGELGDALVAAFQDGTNAAEAFGAVFDDVIRNAVLNAFKLEYLGKPIDDWLNKLSEYMGDGVLSDWEMAALDDFKQSIYEQSQAGWDAISQLWDVSGTDAQGIQGDVHNMTEDTGIALVGSINGMRVNVDAILNNHKTFIELMDGFSRHLEKIEENTAFCRKLKDIDETLLDLKINGIKIK